MVLIFCNFFLIINGKPYIIWLTDRIASGKSSEAIEKLGSGHINCDTLAYKLYAPGMKCINLNVKAHSWF